MTNEELPEFLEILEVLKFTTATILQQTCNNITATATILSQSCGSVKIHAAILPHTSVKLGRAVWSC